MKKDLLTTKICRGISSLIYDGIEQALPIIVDRAVDGAFYWAGRGWNAAVNYGKRKIADCKSVKQATLQKKAAVTNHCSSEINLQ